MILGRPIFPGNDGEQLNTIRRVMQTPIDQVFGTTDVEELIHDMLAVDPRERLSARGARAHSFFPASTQKKKPQTDEAHAGSSPAATKESTEPQGKHQAQSPAKKKASRSESNE